MPEQNQIKKDEAQTTEIIKINPQDIQDLKNDDAVLVEPNKLDVKRGGNIIVGTINVFTQPAKKRWQRFYHPKNPHWQWHLAVDIILALIVVGLLATNSYLLLQPIFGVGRQIEITVATEPAQAVSGQRLSYIIDYRNNAGTKIKATTLTVNLPKSFSLQSADPANLYDSHLHTFNLGDIDHGANGRLKITGIILGQVGANQSLQADLNYTPGNSSLRQYKTAVYSYPIAASLIKLTLEAPAKISNGQTAKLTLNYENLSAIDFDQLTIKDNFGSIGFQPQTAAPEQTDGAWIIKDFKAGSQGQINITGRFLAKNNQAKQRWEFTASINSENNELVQAKAGQDVEIIYPKLSISFRPAKADISPAEAGQYIIDYQNNEDSAIDNLTIKAEFSGPFASAPEITWTKKQLPALAQLAKGQTGEIKFTYPAKAGVNQSSADQKNYLLTGWAETYYNLPGNDFQAFKASDQARQKVNTDLALNAFARYYTEEGDQIGRGPVPPIAGQTTKYWIFLAVNNSYNDAKDIAISATLPANVELTENTSVTAGENIKYDAATRQITWQVDQAPAPSSFYPALGAAFEVGLTPAGNQIGRTAILIADIRISGTDTFTGEKIISQAADITTDLTVDKMETSGGKVRSK